jgi:hypothetical protein
MIKLIASLTEPFFHLEITGIIEGSFNFATIVFLFGGGFIMYTAVREISHMLSIDDLGHEGDGAGDNRRIFRAYRGDFGLWYRDVSSGRPCLRISAEKSEVRDPRVVYSANRRRRTTGRGWPFGTFEALWICRRTDV